MGQVCNRCLKKKTNQNSQNSRSQSEQGPNQQILQGLLAESILEIDENAEPQSSTEAIQIKEDEPRINKRTESTMKDFKLLKTLGRGSFGKILLVEKEGKLFAMKIIKKQDIIGKNLQQYTQNERFILASNNYEFTVKLHYAFQSEHKLYLIMDFCQGGELYFHLRKAYKFDETTAKFYAVELILALAYLHSKDIIYRDLKPENILICKDGHIKLVDFGLSKYLKQGDTAYSIVGTPEYLAPEVCMELGHNETCDWWSLGALLYEMLTGAAPFYSTDKTLMFRNRFEKKIEMKPWFSQSCSSFLSGILMNDPQQRLGVNGVQELKEHEFFSGVDWEAYLQKKIVPPIVPLLAGERDLKYFNKMFTDEPARDSPVYTSSQVQQFDDFSYDRSYKSQGSNSKK